MKNKRIKESIKQLNNDSELVSGLIKLYNKEIITSDQLYAAVNQGIITLTEYNRILNNKEKK